MKPVVVHSGHWWRLVELVVKPVVVVSGHWWRQVELAVKPGGSSWRSLVEAGGIGGGTWWSVVEVGAVWWRFFCMTTLEVGVLADGIVGRCWR